MSLQEETLMFSSLNVIEDAEYTFHTAFQDHQYKVTTRCMLFINLFLKLKRTERITTDFLIRLPSTYLTNLDNLIGNVEKMENVY